MSNRFPRFNVWLDWGSGWTAMHDYGGRDLVRQSGFSKEVTLHKDLKPVQDKATFTLDFVTSIANILLTLDYDQIVKVDIDRIDKQITSWRVVYKAIAGGATGSYGSLIGGGGATGTFDVSLTGGGGATGTFGELLGGNDENIRSKVWRDFDAGANLTDREAAELYFRELFGENFVSASPTYEEISTDWFFGHVRPITSYDIDLDDKVIEVEALDNSWRLERSSSSKYDATDIRLDLAIQTILSRAGYSFTERKEVLPLSNNVGRLVLDEFGDPLKDTLEELLFAYGYVYYFDGSGVFQMYSWITDDATTTYNVNESVMVGTLEVNRDDERIGVKFNPNAPLEKLEVKGYKNVGKVGTLYANTERIKASKGDLVPGNPTIKYNDFKSQIEGRSDVIEIVEFLDPSFTLVRSTWQSKNETTIGPISFTGHPERTFLHGQSGGLLDNILTTLSINDDNKTIDIQFTAPDGVSRFYSDDETIALLSYQIDGSVRARVLSDITEEKVPAGLADEIENQYVEAGTDQGLRIINEIVNRAETAIYRYSFRSELFYEIGSYVRVQSTSLNIDTTARVINRTYDYNNTAEIYEYELEGVEEIGSLFGSITAINGVIGSSTGKVTSSVAAVEKGLTATGSLKKIVSGNEMTETEEIDGVVYDLVTPLEDGIFFNNVSMGFYDPATAFWPVRIYNDSGTGKLFAGNSTKYIEWTGSELNVKGAATIDGTITSGDGIKSSDWTGSGSTVGWQINGDGDVTFNNGTFRGDLDAAGGTFSGDLSAAGGTFSGDISAASGTFTGSIEANTGEIGGFEIMTTKLQSTDTNHGLIMDSDERRFEVRDAVGTPKAALGYLGNLAGTSFTSSEFGLFVGDGNTVSFTSGADFEEGSYFINADAAFVAISGDSEAVRLGSLGSGDIGLDIGGMRFGNFIGGGGATGTFEATVTGGGGATGTFESTVTGGGGVFASRAGLLYSLADDTLHLTGTLSGVDGVFSGALEAATGTFTGALTAATGTFAGSLEAATGTFNGDLNAAGGTFSGNLSAVGGSFTGSLNAAEFSSGLITGDVIIETGGEIKSQNYSSGSTGWRISDNAIEIDDGTFRGDITGGSIDIGSGAFTVNSSGAVTGSDITITGGSITGGSINIGSGDFKVSSSGQMEAKEAIFENSIEIQSGNVSKLIKLDLSNSPAGLIFNTSPVSANYLVPVVYTDHFGNTNTYSILLHQYP